MYMYVYIHMSVVRMYIYIYIVYYIAYCYDCFVTIVKCHWLLVTDEACDLRLEPYVHIES